MPLRFRSLLFVLLGPIRSVNCDNSTEKCDYALNITNDGPVTLDVPVTLKSVLECSPKSTSFLYEFRDDLGRIKEVVGRGSALATFIFSNEIGTHTVDVKVYSLSVPNLELATGQSSFEVVSYIPGSLTFSKFVRGKNGEMYVETGAIVNISIDMSYPARIYRDSEFAYSWTVGEVLFSTSQQYIEHQFNASGVQNIHSSVVARIPWYDGSEGFHYKWGYFGGVLTVKNPFHNINIDGNTYLQHGELLNLAISCNGSGPVEYCWKLLPSSSGNQSQSLSCRGLVSSAECRFPILYYFRESGDFDLAIYVNNVVSSMQRNIQVHIYDVSLRPQLSTVVLPVVCTALVVVILAVALVLQMRRATPYRVETADFDFMREQGSSMETPWQGLRRSLLRLLQFRCLFLAGEGGAGEGDYGTMMVDRRL